MTDQPLPDTARTAIENFIDKFFDPKNPNADPAFPTMTYVMPWFPRHRYPAPPGR